MGLCGVLYVVAARQFKPEVRLQAIVMLAALFAIAQNRERPIRIVWSIVIALVLCALAGDLILVLPFP
jgi:dolichol kinase